MSKIIGICVTLLTVLATSVYARDKPYQPYAMEFQWQKAIAKKNHKNIKDYFLLLPSVFIDCEGAQFGAASTKDEREELITYVDLKNGYLEYAGSQLTLFKDRTNKKDIIAIQDGKCGAGTTCGALNTLIELEGTVWKFRVDLLPKGKRLEELYGEELRSDTVCPYFDLPRIGTTILVKNECLINECNPQSIVARYLWTGERFIIEE